MIKQLLALADALCAQLMEIWGNLSLTLWQWIDASLAICLQLGALLRNIFLALMQLFRWIGRGILEVIVSTLNEIGERALAYRLWGIKRAFFLAPAPEEGVVFGPLAELLTGAGVVAVVLVLAILTPYLVGFVGNWYENLRNEKAAQANRSEVQGKIFASGGAYQGMPIDLGYGWRPGPAEQKFLKGMADANLTPATSAGTGTVDDQPTVVNNGSNPGEATATGGGTATHKTSAPSPPSQKFSNPNPRYSVETFPISNSSSGVFNEGVLQAMRTDAASRGDTTTYNRLIDEHKQLYRQQGLDPCDSGFFPQSLCH